MLYYRLSIMLYKSCCMNKILNAEAASICHAVLMIMSHAILASISHAALFNISHAVCMVFFIDVFESRVNAAD